MTKNGESDPISSVLRAAIVARGQTILSAETGIPQPNLSAFVAGRRGITLDSADRLAVALGLRLTDSGPRKKSRKIPPKA